MQYNHTTTKNVILHLLQICPNINMKLNKCVHGLDGIRILIILKPCDETSAFQCRITLNINTLEMSLNCTVAECNPYIVLFMDDTKPD